MPGGEWFATVAVVSLRLERLSTGADIRVSGPSGPDAVLLLGGTSRAEMPGTWGTSIRWLADAARERFPDHAVAELRYFVKSWKRLDLLEADARAAIEWLVANGAQRITLVGFSGGGTAGLSAADEPGVTTLIALAPWLPAKADPPQLRNRRIAVIHGTLDGLPLLPGTNPRASRAALPRLAALGAATSYTRICGAVHGIVLTAPWGGIVRLPRAARWRELVLDELATIQLVASSS